MASRRKKWWYEFLPKSYTCFFLEKYTAGTFKKDLIAGITVGIVALPFGHGICDCPQECLPKRGIFTAIIAGFLVSLFEVEAASRSADPPAPLSSSSTALYKEKDMPASCSRR